MRRRRPGRTLAGGLGAGLLGLVLAVTLTPLPEEVRQLSPSPRVLGRDGTLLHEALSTRQTRGGPVSLDALSPHAVNATLAGEDHRFFRHPGIDPVALVRAAWLDLLVGRWAYGGSTLTQQLARLLFPGPRTLPQKLREAFWALVMESKLSKREILEAYLSRAPYGGLLTGMDAASRAYFGKPPALLSLAEASLLAALPRAPDRYDLRRGEGRVLARRHHLLELMVKQGTISAAQAAQAEEEPLQRGPGTVPLRAPHAVRRILAQVPPGQREVRTTLDVPLQERVEELVRLTVKELAERGVTQAAALVVEVPSGEVRASVGSADFLDPEHSGQVDGTHAWRSPGSALKPLVYAAALDARLITPASVLEDVAAAFPAAAGAFLPRNFDEREHGPVLARTALACSYNLAAVDLAARLGPVALLDILARFGVPSAALSPEALGLGVVLGGVDVRLWDLAGAYLTLARGGSSIPLTMIPRDPPAGQRVLGAGAAWLVTDMLADDVARAPAFGRGSVLSLPFPAAVKTGTSKDFRDNWTVGFSTRFLVATWVGDFSGAPMHGVSGVTGAGTLWHRVMRAAHPGLEPAPFSRPAELADVEVCALSGQRAGPHCPQRRVETFLPGTQPQHACSFHPAPGRLVLPAVFHAWAQQAGLSAEGSGAGVRVLFPRDGAEFRLDPDRPRDGRGMRLRVAAPSGVGVGIVVDGVEVARGVGGASVAWEARRGTHVVEAVAGEERAAARFLVE